MTIGSIMSLLKTIWEAWSLRTIVLLSLSMQVVLIFLAPLRKRSANACLISSLWFAYLLADWAAAFAAGHISYHQMNDKSAPDENGDLLAFWAPFLLVHLGGPDTITAFAVEDSTLWRRHLLNLIFQVCVSIFVFYQTLPKNKLWLPTLLMLFVGLIKNVERIRAMYLPSLRRFREGISGHSFGLEDPKWEFKTSSELFEKEIEMVEGDLAERAVVEYGYQLSEVFFEVLKGLTVESFSDSPVFKSSRIFFLKRTAVDAFKVISVELNFMYENLYTKMLVVHSKFGYFFRVVASSIVVVTLVLFTCSNKHQYDIYDCMVTYVLLYGAVGLDVIALLMLMFSDWGVVTFKRTPILNWFLARYVSFLSHRNKPCFTTCHIKPTARSKESLGTQILKKLCSTKCIPFVTGNDKSTFATGQLKPPIKYEVLDTKVWFRRWSESICAYNLLTESLLLYPRKILKNEKKSLWRTVLFIPRVVALCFCLIGWSILRSCHWLIKVVFAGLAIPFGYFIDELGLREVLNNVAGFCVDIFLRPLIMLCNCLNALGLFEMLASTEYVSRNPFPAKLWGFIFYEMKVKSEMAEDIEMAKRIYEAKGEWVLEHGEWPSDVKNRLMTYVTGGYGKILLQWHMATELCYNTNENLNTDEDESVNMDENLKTEENMSTQNDEREFSKILSDYMLYLLIKQPKMLSSWAAASHQTFLLTLSKVRYWNDNKIRKVDDELARTKNDSSGREMEEDNRLRNFCQGLLNMDPELRFEEGGERSAFEDGYCLAKELRKMEDKWKIMSRVWVELLSHAAVHCKAEAYAQTLTRGGELITFVWLLMLHFGLEGNS